MLVKHLMTADPISIAPDMSVAEAGELMTGLRIRHLPVMDGGILVGLVTRSSLARALPGLGTGLTRFEYDYLTSHTKVRDVMITKPVLGTEDMAAEEAARVMNEHRISSLIVVRDDTPVGIITDTDIFKAMLELLGARRLGARVTLHLENRPGALAQVSGAIAEVGGNILAVGGWPVSEEVWGTVLKIENLSEDQVQTAVGKLPGVTVVDLRG